MSHPPLTPTGRPWPAARPRRRFRLAGVLLVSFLAIVMALSGLVMLAFISSSTGEAGFVIGLFFALLPVVPVTAALRWLDRFEPEPPGVLLFAFFWGACVAALVAAVLNSATVAVLAADRPGAGLTATAVYVAPWVEEACKGAAVLLVFWFRRREFDGIVDGIVVAGFAGIGFAFSENILYFGRAFLDGSADVGVGGGLFAAGFTFVLRGVLSPFAHPLFTMATGVGLGVAARSRSGAARLFAGVVGYLVAVTLHAVWNFTASQGLSRFFAGYLLFMIPVFAVAVAVAVWSRRREGRLIASQLPAYVRAGWLSPGDVPMLASMSSRRAARAWAAARGAGGVRAMREFQHAATELAFLRDRMARGTAGPDAADRELGLLGELHARRSQLAGPA